HVGVLIERLTYGEPQPPQRDVIRNLRMAGRSEQDGVVVPDLVAAVLRHHAAVLLVVFATPVEMVDLEAEAAVALGDRVQHLDAGGSYFRADPVAGDGRDGIGFHDRTPKVATRVSHLNEPIAGRKAMGPAQPLR